MPKKYTNAHPALVWPSLACTGCRPRLMVQTVFGCTPRSSQMRFGQFSRYSFSRRSIPAPSRSSSILQGRRVRPVPSALIASTPYRAALAASGRGSTPDVAWPNAPPTAFVATDDERSSPIERCWLLRTTPHRRNRAVRLVSLR